MRVAEDLLRRLYAHTQGRDPGWNVERIGDASER
jgi:hypothetical protein